MIRNTIKQPVSLMICVAIALFALVTTTAVAGEQEVKRLAEPVEVTETHEYFGASFSVHLRIAASHNYPSTRIGSNCTSNKLPRLTVGFSGYSAGIENKNIAVGYFCCPGKWAIQHLFHDVLRLEAVYLASHCRHRHP